ncbi:HAD-IA family hydrolase [Caulobacter sp. S45]|uniref:HAD-IA family hydrolase n=1 Tax=Caulobacter sp. S45 TaxID=1641861 RepID=UPI001575AE0A|nr:HAD-IA family hydrolase [Caulobacter sp. S45]
MTSSLAAPAPTTFAEPASDTPAPGRLDGATIAFDLDGTLVNTAPDLVGALNVVLGERGLPHVLQEAAGYLVGKGARALITRGFALAGEPLREEEVAGLVVRFVEAYRARIASESRPYPGLEAALQSLAEAGATLCVCTNKRTDLSLALLDALGLTGRFAAVTGADRAPAPKPDPSHFLVSIAEADGDPAYAVLVGDSANDVRSAHAAGAPVVVVSFGYTDIPPSELGGDALIDRFDELPVAVETILAGLRQTRSRALPGPEASAIDPLS